MNGAPPLWFLDVDGVINSEGKPQFGDTHRSVDIIFRGWPVVLDYQPAVIDRINTLVSAGLVEPVWLTTWRDETASVLTPTVGFNSVFPVIPEPPGQQLAAHPGDLLGRTWWKVAALLARLEREPGRRFIWTDDELPSQVRQHVTEAAPASTSLMMRPLEMPGLDLDHLDRIEEFARSNRTH